MQAGSKKGSKKATKLSLAKRAQKGDTSAEKTESSAGKNTGGIKRILPGKVDLNETCEFRQPMKFSKQGDKTEDREIAATSEVCGVDGDEALCCQVCNKDLSHMSLSCREQHVNRCIDETEVTAKQEREEQRLLESARTAVLDCPMCGKHFKSETARLAHLKKCSQNVGVSTEKMLQLVKDQEKERQEQLAAGIVPQQLRSKVSKSAPKKRKLKEPKSQFEEDVQVAMAISSSLAPEQTVVDGLSAGDSAKEGKRKKNRKARLEDVCLLTTLTDEDRKKRMEEKINSILQMANNVNSAKDTCLHDSCLKSGSQETGHSLWKICSQDPVQCDNHLFYVGALVPPLSISHMEPGKCLRRLSSIPGREKSFIRKNDSIQEKCPSGTSNISADDIITASTQTAVVLAELAVDDTDIVDSIVGPELTPDPVHSDNMVDLQASGFCVEKLVLDENDKNTLVSETLRDYKRMINNKDYRYSDVTVISCRQSIYAHQVILAARCPKLLQMMTDGTIHLDVPPDIVLSLLNYIYTGEVNLTSSAKSDLLNLAKQLELPSLIDACSKAVVEMETSETFAAKENIEASDTDHVESQLDMREIWGESESDPDTDKDGEMENKTDSGINDDDYREISCTQKKRLKEKIAHDKDNNKDLKGKAVFSKNAYKHLNCTNESNEIDTVLQMTEIEECGPDSVKSCQRKMTDTDSSNNQNASESEETCEILDTRPGEEPNPKRMRLSSDKEAFSEANMCAKGSLEKPINKSINESVHEEYVNSPDEDVCGSINDEETADTTNSGINSSTVDLFGSPTPKKSAAASAYAGKGSNETTSPQSFQRNSKFSTALEEKIVLNMELSKDEVNSTHVVNLDTESNSSSGEIIDLNKEVGEENLDVKSSENSTPGLENPTIKTNLQHECSVRKSEEHIDSDMIELQEENFTNAQQSEQNNTKVSIDTSDDDLEITGDNFDELTQQSPTFKHGRKCSGTQGVNSSKYLGLRSITEGLSERRELNYEKKCDKNNLKNCSIVSGEHCNDPAMDENAIDSVRAAARNFSNVKAFKSKCFTDAGSDTKEIVTMETEGSETCDGQSIDSEINRATTENIDLPSQVDLSDDAEQKMSKVGRKSESYGKHEISAYSGVGDNTITCQANQSFEGNNTDVWDDFDDCGVMYEPPCGHSEEVSLTSLSPNVSPRETSPVVGYQHVEENPGETSPIIPQQTEVIDLSQNDDNNVYEDNVDDELDDNLLEDGDDSFVFKVDDQPDGTDKLPTKTKSTDFKTPTVDNDRGKKKPAWVPPSPFTPMPLYGTMATPALKKEVHKFGVKPVGKKRMIKVLEDIYQQTHQYETDNECEDGVDDQGEQVARPSGNSSDDLPCSQDDVSSQDCEFSDLLEESCLHTGLSSDSDTSPCTSPQKGVDLTKKLFDFVKSRPDIHSKILMYEPLELDVLKSEIKDAGLRCSMEKLMNFLDERCIAFTSKNTRKKRQPAKRGRKKAATSKQTES